MASGLYYLRPTSAIRTGQRVAERLREIAAERGTEGNCVHYFRCRRASFPCSSSRSAAGGIPWRPGGRRLIVEKPFGHDLASARASSTPSCPRYFVEEQIFRIDHYLGKETVQNILVFRFANGIFEPIWNRRYVDHVQITVAETIGVEGRAATTRRPARCATWSRTTCCSSSR